MIPTKQTVYLPVNVLDETSVIVINQGANTLLDKVKRQEGYFFTPEQLNEYTQSVIKQALETAAEKALCDFDEGGCTEFVDEKSITNTFEETFKLFEL